jgi:beta-N-acetylhexosaminidase
VRLGLNKRRLVDVEAINTILESPETEAVAQAETDHAVTLVKNDKDVFPLSNASQACLYVLPESRLSRQGLKLMEQVTARAPELRTTLLDPTLPESVFEDIAAQTGTLCKTVLIAAFASVTEYRGEVALAGGYSAFVQNLLKGKVPVGMVSLGNPYLLRSFPGVAAYATTYSTTPLAEVSAVKSIFGEMKLTGRLPVTIPGIAKLGDGIQLPARTTATTH